MIKHDKVPSRLPFNWTNWGEVPPCMHVVPFLFFPCISSLLSPPLLVLHKPFNYLHNGRKGRKSLHVPFHAHSTGNSWPLHKNSTQRPWRGSRAWSVSCWLPGGTGDLRDSSSWGVTTALVINRSDKLDYSTVKPQSSERAIQPSPPSVRPSRDRAHTRALIGLHVIFFTAIYRRCCGVAQT